MIRVLAQIVSRQIRTPIERIRDEPDPPPPRCPNAEQASSPDAERAATNQRKCWQGSSAQALVVLFAQLAQRHVQAARVQEEIHEYSAHHHDPS
ncbi:hypothetical protein [Dictyobacter formicarum]|uniref:Uncharacterized protein n=1 Tax=Dictyobacter formicarum TaxID=2778368 RepID=A0ABQ3V9X9_9CHLR|nr:hypothetical protein [Dictyobacter formicarum]GHO82590.1 hypothetical protein KSZ_05960 [Dictyobacter formicarum]